MDIYIYIKIYIYIYIYISSVASLTGKTCTLQEGIFARIVACKSFFFLAILYEVVVVKPK